MQSCPEIRETVHTRATLSNATTDSGSEMTMTQMAHLDNNRAIKPTRF